MTKILNNAFQHSEVSNPHSGVRMKFWGVCCVGGKAYKQVVNYRFHLTMAVLDPKSYDKDLRDKTVTLSVIQHGQVFLLCVLRHGEIQQVNLNLIFDKGDNVTFSVGGYGTVHLTGYQLIDSSDSAFDKDEHYCPVAELRSEKQVHKRLNAPVNGVETKHKEKLLFRALKGTTGDFNDDDDDEDEDDSDFAAEFEEIEDEEESDEELISDEDIEIEEDEIKALHEEYEIETPPKSEVSQKRKLGKAPLSQKRLKKERHESESEEDIPVLQEEDKSDSDEGGLNSSIGNTPMPKKLDDSAKSKKKSKKKKRLSEISTLGRSEKVNDDVSPEITTPKKKLNNKQPVIKIEGGVEYQDVVVGNGPEATNGKVVSVFYVGRLENKQIFDARCAPKKPFSFKLGVPEVIRGFDIGIKGMKVGGQRKLKIPPHMGYGSRGMSSVPSNSTLFFTIELINVN